MHVRCPRCDEDEYLGYSICSRCGLRFQGMRVVQVPESEEKVDVECEACRVQALLGHRFCANCGRALESSGIHPAEERLRPPS
jgi:predicted amidophosphoribosyltransferase